MFVSVCVLTAFDNEMLTIICGGLCWGTYVEIVGMPAAVSRQAVEGWLCHTSASVDGEWWAAAVACLSSAQSSIFKIQPWPYVADHDVIFIASGN